MDRSHKKSGNKRSPITSSRDVSSSYSYIVILEEENLTKETHQREREIPLPSLGCGMYLKVNLSTQNQSELKRKYSGL